MRVLVVAPQSNLQNISDWVAAARGHELTVLNDSVSVREVLGCISGGGFQIVHFAGHGCTDALEVSNGSIPEHLLEDAFRAAGTVELAILGACSSVAIGARLYMAGVPRVISWRTDVDDHIAAVWAQAFYASLQLSADVWDATQTAGEAVRRLGAEPPIYLNGRMAVLENEIKTMRRTTKFGGAPIWVVVLLLAELVMTAGSILFVALR